MEYERMRFSTLSTAIMVAAAATIASSGWSGVAVAQEQITVACESIHHEVSVNFSAGSATGDGNWNVCVSTSHPTVVRGVVLPFNGTATGSAGAATMAISTYRVRWLDAQANIVVTSQSSLSMSYIGPIPNAMVGTITAVAPDAITVLAGTASRTCPNSNTCGYFNGLTGVNANLLNIL